VDAVNARPYRGESELEWFGLLSPDEDEEPEEDPDAWELEEE